MTTSRSSPISEAMNPAESGRFPIGSSGSADWPAARRSRFEPGPAPAGVRPPRPVVSSALPLVPATLRRWGPCRGRPAGRLDCRARWSPEVRLPVTAGACGDAVATPGPTRRRQSCRTAKGAPGARRWALQPVSCSSGCRPGHHWRFRQGCCRAHWRRFRARRTNRPDCH